MTSSKRILWGVVLIGLGVLATLRAVGIDIFFPGWWTLFIIIPCGISAVTDKDKTFGIVGLAVGIILLLKKQGLLPWFTFQNIWTLAVPVLLVAFGLSMIFRGATEKQPKEAIRSLNSQSLPMADCRAYFRRKQLDYTKAFNKANLVAVCGTVACDMRGGNICGDIVINAHNFMGNVNICIPDGVNVKIVSSSVFSSVDNRKKNEYPGAPTVYIHNTSLFGGLTVM